MQTSETIELAALTAMYGPALVAGDSGPEITGIEEYWTASKCRFDRWASTLGRLKRGETPLFDAPFGTLRGLFEEILGSEVLTRVWTATVTAYDRRRDEQDNEIVARSVYIGHQELRQRVLKLLLHGPDITAVEAVELNRLRRRAEQWTDLLLASLSGSYNVAEFAFEPERARVYASDLAPIERDESGLPRSPVDFIQTTIQATVRHTFAAPAPNPDLNASVASSVLGAFPTSHFDSLGLFRSLWLVRLARTADDAQQLINDLFRDEERALDAKVVSRRFR